MAFMVWCDLWQWIAQSPGSSALNSKARMPPTGISIVTSGQRALSGTQPPAVHVDRMIGHGEIAHTHAHTISFPHDKGIDPRKGAAIPGPQIEVEHGHDLGHVAAGIDVVGVHD